MTHSARIITLTAPSCAGKTTLVRKLLALPNTPFTEIVSFTSREPRSGEVDGIDYYFKSIEECERLIDEGLTAEHIKFKNCHYGIERREIDIKIALGKVPLVIVEPNGLKQLRRKYECFVVYIDSNLETLYTRFLTRFRGMPNANIEYEARRLMSIQSELMSWEDEVEDVTGGRINYCIPLFNADSETGVIQTMISAAGSDLQYP